MVSDYGGYGDYEGGYGNGGRSSGPRGGKGIFVELIFLLWICLHLIFFYIICKFTPTQFPWIYDIEDIKRSIIHPRSE